MSLRVDINKMTKLQYASAIRWGLTVVSFPAGISGISSEDINVRAYSTAIPTTTAEEAPVENRGNIIWQPGIIRYPGSIDLSFHEAEDGKMADFLYKWRNLTWKDETGVTEPCSNLKSTWKLSLLTSKDTIRENYTLYGCWLKNYSATDLGSTGSETIKFNVTLQYDYFLKS